jgi:capsular polysaccharide biosynthesis protein
MTDRDQTVRYSMNGNHDRPAHLTGLPGFPGQEDQPADVSTGLVSLGYIWAAIRRSVLFVGILVIVGVLIGVGVFVKEPPAYKAQTTLLITYAIGENPSMEQFDNQAIAQSHTVAQAAMDKLGIHQSIGSFAASYTVVIITERVMKIIASAPSASGAVDKASAVATAFLQYKAHQEETAQKVTVAALQLQLTQDRQTMASLNARINQVKAQPATPAQQAALAKLQSEEGQAANLEGTLEGTIAQFQTGSGLLTAVKGSIVLDPAALVPYSKTKYLVTYAVYGLIGGLAIAIAVIIIRALLSDKLRRRDDIARALGAQVGLSTSAVRLGRRLRPGRRGLAAAADPAIQRIVAHLRGAASTKDGHLALVVVPVDGPDVAALSLVALAASYAQQGRKVIVADLAPGKPAATLLGQKNPGVSTVQTRQGSLTLAVPFPEDFDASAPGSRGAALTRPSKLGEALGDAYSSTDVLLTLGTLDAARGGDHLATWADNAVVFITAGRSSWTSIEGTGEMARLAGLSVVSTVLIGADESDKSLGLLRSDPDVAFSIGSLS